ncbi:hypothetical protein BDN72DRAFT_960703 [Pluteus cervinus]|uniref:Uncharacterized protein n=1 Tax=Pluteus cervinus TaxID=181527 RepID=A0ACD3AQC8_9AGAR|nr:hypothetical protein BDN72DRAFT_960703 [Pluteus cervinus]
MPLHINIGDESKWGLKVKKSPEASYESSDKVQLSGEIDSSGITATLDDDTVHWELSEESLAERLERGVDEQTFELKVASTSRLEASLRLFCRYHAGMFHRFEYSAPEGEDFLVRVFELTENKPEAKPNSKANSKTKKRRPAEPKEPEGGAEAEEGGDEGKDADEEPNDDGDPEVQADITPGDEDQDADEEPDNADDAEDDSDDESVY